MKKLFFAALLAVAFVACSKDEESVSFKESQISLDYGQTKSLSLNGADIKDAVITFSKERIVSVSNGVITPIKIGETTITATIGSDVATCVVTVKPTVFMYDEPCVNFKATMNDVKAFEKREIYKETTSQIAYYGENSNVRYVFYTFENGVLIVSCVMVANNTAASALSAEFLLQRYDYNYMSDDLIFFSTDTYNVTFGYNDNYGLNCLYYPLTTKSASPAKIPMSDVLVDEIIFN